MNHRIQDYIAPVSQDSLEEAIERGEPDTGSAELIRRELDYVRRWREVRESGGATDDHTGRDLVGLALSGGGIRSATFSLGILQALAGRGLLKRIDYLSSVSGGGYIGSALTWLTSRQAQSEPSPGAPQAFGTGADDFPFGTDDPRPDGPRTASRKQRRMLQYLREHGYYLTPGAGINAFSLLSAVLRGTFLNLLVWIPLSILVFLLLMWLPLILVDEAPGGRLVYTPVLQSLTPGLECPTPSDQELAAVSALPGCSADWQAAPTAIEEIRATLAAARPYARTLEHVHYLFLFEIILILGLFILAVMLLLAVPYSIATWFTRGESRGVRTNWYRIRRWVEKAVGIAFPLGLLGLLIGSLPLATAYLMSWMIITGPTAIIGGMAIALRDFLLSGEQEERKSSGLLVNIGAGLFLYGIAVSSYQVAFSLSASEDALYHAVLLFLPVLLLGWFVNLNYISIHRFYRDRLMETFMPDIPRVLGDRSGAAFGANAANLHEISPADQPHGPYHIVNTNAVLVSSKQPLYSNRGGDNFILSPLYCGSNATGWRRTDSYMAGKMTLATAVAISGAAANPNTGVGGVGLTRNLFVSLTMSLLNLRLGYWAEHPNPTLAPGNMPNHFRPGAYALGNVLGFLGGGYNEHRAFVQLSDGGHFENMALYELIRRRVKLAIVCDGGADPEFSFSDMQTTVRRIEDDFGARIQVLDQASPDNIVPRVPDEASYPGETGFSDRGYMLGHIRYADASHGWLIFLKTTLIREVSFKVKGYKARHPAFPDESTADQFFDEVQFEAYRELGYCIAEQMLASELPEQIGSGRLADLIRHCGEY